MGIFGLSTDAAITDEVETATSEKNLEEDWSLIMNICDKAGKSSEDAKSYLKAISRRLHHGDPHVGVKAVTLLDACVKNSGKVFHVEVASRDFENDFTKLMTKAHPTVSKKLRESLRKWADNEFKADPQLSLIPTLLSKLKSTGLDFSVSETPVKKSAPLSKDPNVVETQEEEEQILKAIELSLKESGSPRSAANVSSSHTTSSSLYPSMGAATATAAPAAAGAAGGQPVASGGIKEPRKVRALYDFEAAEDNELTFYCGEIVFVMDDSDPNWWKGSNQRGEGLFPANFVTADLSVEPEKFLYEKAKKMVQFKETAEVKVVKEDPVEVKEEPEVKEEEPQDVEVNEHKIDRLLHLLHEADPTNPEKDTQEMLTLEKEVNAMGPLIDSELEKVDRKHAQLTQLSADLVEALGLYHTLMREPVFPPLSKMPYGFPPTSSPMPYNGTLPPTAHHPMMQGPDRPPFMHPAAIVPPGMMPHHFQQHLAQQQAGGPQMPPPHIQPPMQGPPAQQMAMHMQHQQQMIEERRLEQHLMQYGGGPGLQSFGPGSMVGQSFPPPPSSAGPAPPVQNGPPQPPGLQYVTSSTHMTH